MLIKYDRNSVAVQDSDYVAHTIDFGLYTQENNLKKPSAGILSTTAYDFLFDTPCDDIPAAVSAINNVSTYAANQGYVVNKMIGSQATMSAVENAITGNNLISMGNIGHGETYGILLYNGFLDNTWFAAHDLGGTIFFFNSCNVFNDPLKSAMLNSAHARTFIGGVYDLSQDSSEFVFQDWWNYTLNSGWKMSDALTQAMQNHGFESWRYNLAGDIGIIPYATSGTLSRNETWSRNVTLTGPVTVPSGFALTIKSTATINLNTFSIVSTGGTITVQSGANVRGAQLRNLNPAIIGLYPTIQTAVNAATGNQMIVISGGTFSENVSAMYKSDLNISGSGDDYTTIAGSLTFSSCPNLMLQAFNCYHLTLLSCNLACIWCSAGGNPSETAVNLYLCSAFCRDGCSYNSLSGLLAYQSSGEIDPGSEFYSNLTGAATSTYSNVCAAGARFCTSINYDFTTQQFGCMNAYDCYYRNGICRYANNRGGTVYFYGSNYSCASLSKSGPSTKMPKELTSGIRLQRDDSAQVEFSKVNTSYFSLLRTIKEEAKKNGLSNNGQLHAEYLAVLKEFKTFIKNNPQSPLAMVALTTAANGYGVFGDYEEMKGLLNEIMAGGKPDQLKDVAKDLMVDYYRKTKDYDGAISAADAFVKDCKGDSELVADVIFKKGLTLYYDKKMPGDAAICFSTIVKNYPGTEVAGLAQNQLQSLEGQANESADSTGIAASQGIIMVNYPNPFNPSTTIQYQLSENNFVTLKVYDVLGREVETLVNEYKTAGNYQAKFNASHLASGVYFYKLQTGKFALIKKMLLLK
jgi:tetratricopeptide (TPR) repeat protein